MIVMQMKRCPGRFVLCEVYAVKHRCLLLEVEIAHFKLGVCVPNDAYQSSSFIAITDIISLETKPNQTNLLHLTHTQIGPGEGKIYADLTSIKRGRVVVCMKTSGLKNKK